jgi:hypothetical protein
MIRHASLRPAPPVLALAVPMILPSLLTLLVAAIGATPLTEPGLPAASETAIALAAITTAAEEKDRAAIAARASPSPENHFAQNRHACSQAD